MAEKAINLGAYRGTTPCDADDPSHMARKIADFLGGRDDGAEIFRALYGDAVAEPLPPRLSALLQRWRVS